VSIETLVGFCQSYTRHLVSSALKFLCLQELNYTKSSLVVVVSISRLGREPAPVLPHWAIQLRKQLGKLSHEVLIPGLKFGPLIVFPRIVTRSG
jgi:hypothetical protein